MITFAAFSKGARQTANYAPLAAALLAPASTLYDIPALSQKWYSFNGVDQPDPPASLILSGFSLAISIIANVFLVVRFSVRWAKAWRWATRLSLAGWIVKTIIGVANLITFGATTRNGEGYSYNQAFWCAIVSVVISGIISLLLISHYTLHFTYTPDPDLRFQGRAIITSELLLFALIALNALVFSRIEGWSYLDAIYFSVVSILSIGFGDFQPTHTSTKILLFPYFITGVSLLANQISIIVNATSHRSKTRKLEFRQRYANRIAEREAKQDKCDDVSEVDVLHGEIRRLRKQAEAEEDATEMVELFYSACTLVSFWLLGALIFHFMEGWTYGNALYFNYVFLFTIGYGDYSPQTPVGRTVFIIWALISVPIMTQFVVQTIQTITGHASKVIALATSQKRLERERVQKEFFAPHGSYLEEAIESINDTSSPSTSSDSTAEEQEEEQEQIEREATEGQSEQISVQKDLLFDLLSTASLLEAQARGIIVDNMDKHSHARLLLLADGNVQLYTLKKLGAEKQLSKLKKVHETIGESKDVELERVRQYRKTYAKLLAMGSKLMQFEGDQLSAYQRRESVKDG